MINDQCKIKVIGEIMSIKKLIAYTQIGAEYLRNQQIRQQVHEEKIKKIMSTLSDEDYQQVLNLAKERGDIKMLEELPIMRALLKTNGVKKDD